MGLGLVACSIFDVGLEQGTQGRGNRILKVGWGGYQRFDVVLVSSFPYNLELCVFQLKTTDLLLLYFCSYTNIEAIIALEYTCK